MHRTAKPGTGKVYKFVCNACKRPSESRRNQAICFSCSAKKGSHFRDRPDLSAVQLEIRMIEIVANETRMPWDRK